MTAPSFVPDNALAKGNKLAGRPKPRPLDGATWDMRARGPKAAHIALLFPDSLEDAGPDPKAKPEKKQKNINKTVEKLLKKYPPQVKK